MQGTCDNTFSIRPFSWRQTARPNRSRFAEMTFLFSSWFAQTRLYPPESTHTASEPPLIGRSQRRLLIRSYEHRSSGAHARLGYEVYVEAVVSDFSRTLHLYTPWPPWQTAVVPLHFRPRARYIPYICTVYSSYTVFWFLLFSFW